jgi:shikimate dehydrogenase
MSAQYVVIGHPVNHSLSPRIHQYFAQQTEQDLVYTPLWAPLDGFAAGVKKFRLEGGEGANVTVPFKMEAYQLADQLTPRAQLAQAVNTLSWQIDAQGREQLLGDNTDGVGLLRDLTDNLQLNLQQSHILILGAGGAVRGVLAPLLTAGARLVISNRTPARAFDMISQFAHLGPITFITDHPLKPDQSSKAFDIIINATSASLQQALPHCEPRWISANTVCYDMVYAKQPTPFMQFAAAHGAQRCMDGLGMLIEQAAEAFFVWRGIRPDTKPLVSSRLLGLID